MKGQQQMKNQSTVEMRVQAALKNLALLVSPVKELINGVQTKTLPWALCSGWMLGSVLVLFFKIDYWLIKHTPFTSLYPHHPILYKFYGYCFSTLAFWGWAWNEVRKKNEKLKILTNAFKNAGLQSKIGRLPNLISDFPIDSMTRKMRITNAGFPLPAFREQSKYIESELGIFIDDIKEHRETRAIDFIYSHYPLPPQVSYSPENASRKFEFMVGQTRAFPITASLRSCPHLLIAGQTGGGKSTFLRQLIVHLANQDKGTRFLLIDLKGGLEFFMFENRKQFDVVPHVLAAVNELNKINDLINKRMAFLKAQECKDIEAYFDKSNKPADAPNLSRQIVVIDEAAEMFLAGLHAKANEIQQARAVLSKIARQGRALGVHLIVATQRPDSKSLDPQVKANLTGVICFQMMNDSSSIAVLGNGRATDLPKIPGRAIWKNGIEMIEVQTPYMSPEMAEELLGKPDNIPTQKRHLKIVDPMSNEQDKSKSIVLDKSHDE